MFFVQRQQHLRISIAQIVDEAVMQPAITGARIHRDVSQIQPPDHFRHDVADPFHLRITARNRGLDVFKIGHEILSADFHGAIEGTA
jgi:hypothetical protein